MYSVGKFFTKNIHRAGYRIYIGILKYYLYWDVVFYESNFVLT